MGFGAEQKTVNELLTNKVLSIPRNQRTYVWKQVNWEDLLSDIIFIIDNVDDTKIMRKHFIGSIVLQSEKSVNGKDYYTIIDGQQRTITILLLLAAILKIFQERNMKNNFYGIYPNLITKDRRNKDQCIFTSDNISIQKIIMKIVDYTNEDSLSSIIKKVIVNKREKNIGDCVSYFYNRINEIIKDKEKPNEYLVKISDELLDTKYVKITAATEEDSYTIFEILNARGQILSDQELLKNYIMRYILPQNKVDEVRMGWESLEYKLGKYIDKFFKHYTTHKYKNTNKSSVYRKIQENNTKDNISNLFDDILLKAKYYSIIINPISNGDDKNCSDKEFFIFSFLKSKRAEQYRPIIMSLMHAKDKELLTENKYNEVLQFMYRFFVCYNIIGEEKSNKLEDSVYKYAEILENTFSIDNLNEFIKNLKEKLPTFENFKNSVMNIGWSNHNKFFKDSKNKKRVQTILELLEMNISKKASVDGFTIEHIFPDSEEKDNAIIGNLLPLEGPYNEDCKNKDISYKLQFYKKSDYCITRNFAQRYSNQKFFIKTRTICIAETLYNDILKLS
jgi:Uncharacterized conserved protein